MPCRPCPFFFNAHTHFWVTHYELQNTLNSCDNYNEHSIYHMAKYIRGPVPFDFHVGGGAGPPPPSFLFLFLFRGVVICIELYIVIVHCNFTLFYN